MEEGPAHCTTSDDIVVISIPFPPRNILKAEMSTAVEAISNIDAQYASGLSLLHADATHE
jgi:hypothetical protein